MLWTIPHEAHWFHNVVGRELDFLTCCLMKTKCGRQTIGWSDVTWNKFLGKINFWDIIDCICFTNELTNRLEKLKKNGIATYNTKTHQTTTGSTELTEKQLLLIASIIIELDNSLPQSKAKSTWLYSMPRHIWNVYKKHNPDSDVKSFDVKRQTLANLKKKGKNFQQQFTPAQLQGKASLLYTLDWLSSTWSQRTVSVPCV